MSDTTRQGVPVPSINPESKPFWEATTEGKFLIKHCNTCAENHFYPRSKCPFCHSLDTVWLSCSGEGVIYSFSVMRRVEPNYALVYVTLDEGPTIISNLIDCDFDRLAIGDRVHVTFRDTGEGPQVPYFTPAAAPR